MTVILRTARKHRLCNASWPNVHPVLPGEMYVRHVTFPGEELLGERLTKPVAHDECAHCANERAGWIRGRYGVPARLGGRVVFDGVPGRIVGFSGGHLLLRFGAKHVVSTHPTWNLTYEVAS